MGHHRSQMCRLTAGLVLPALGVDSIPSGLARSGFLRHGLPSVTRLLVGAVEGFRELRDLDVGQQYIQSARSIRELLDARALARLQFQADDGVSMLREAPRTANFRYNLHLAIIAGEVDAVGGGFLVLLFHVVSWFPPEVLFV